MAIVVLLIVGMIALVVVLSMFSAEKRRKRMMAATPRTPIALAAGGVTKIQGRLVHCWPPLYAPISGRPCAAYQVKVLTMQDNKELLLVHEIKGQPFVLHDESGRGMICYDEQTALILKVDFEAKSQTMQDPTPAMLALLQRHNVDSTRAFGLNRGLRYHEAVLEAGELVTVHGIATREQDPDPAAAYAAGFPNPTVWTVMRRGDGNDLTLTDELPFDPGPAPAAPLPGAPPA